MAEITKTFQLSGLFHLFKWMGILVLILAFIFGVTIILNFGTLMKIAFFVLGLFIAKAMIFGGK